MAGTSGRGRLVQPVNIFIEPDGTKYVSDPGRGQVVVFDGKDEFVRALGQPGEWRPVAAASWGDRLYVVDGEHLLVRVVDKTSGEQLATIGDKGEKSERLGRPTNVAFDRAGDLYVSDMGRFQVVRFDQAGKFKGTIGHLGDSLGEFARPKGIAFDPQDRLYAADAAFNNVQIFDHDGRLLLFFGARGEEPGGLLLPAQVTIDAANLKYFQQYVDPNFDAEYLVLATSQFGARRVNVFAFGREKGKAYPSDEELRKEVEARRQKEIGKPSEGEKTPPKENEKPPAD
jgi:DNA-binding beta-propeller fold protein YncE